MLQGMFLDGDSSSGSEPITLPGSSAHEHIKGARCLPLSLHALDSPIAYRYAPLHSLHPRCTILTSAIAESTPAENDTS